MADLGAILGEVNSLPQELRPAFTRILQAILGDLRVGHPTFAARDPLKNFGGAFLHGTTAAIANAEFTIAHGFGRVPYLLIQVLPLDTQGAQIVPLVNSRIADDKRLYLKSSVTSAPVSFWCEG